MDSNYWCEQELLEDYMGNVAIYLEENGWAEAYGIHGCDFGIRGDAEYVLSELERMGFR